MDERLPKYDHTAAKQIFGVKPRERGEKADTLYASKDSPNPIDVELRKLTLMPQGATNINELFMSKWVAAIRADGHGVVVGRIMDVYPDRSLRIQTRKKEDAIVKFENVLELKESEI